MIDEVHSQPWWQLTGDISPAQVVETVRRAAIDLGLQVALPADGIATLTAGNGRVVVSVRWHDETGAQDAEREMSRAGLRVLVLSESGQDRTPGARVADALGELAHPFSEAELEHIVASMPLVRRFSSPDARLGQWALIFRDHYVENSVGFLLGMERAGIAAEWIFALAKGDRTRNRHRIHATFAARGYRSDVFDNAAINAPQRHQLEMSTAKTKLDAFVNVAHEAGRRVLVIDDGGLIACGYGGQDASARIDAAIELTVSGLKRIRAAGALQIPIVNMARSKVKTLVGYPEIADSCVRRLRDILPTHKLIGRSVVVIGYGALGSRIARGLRAIGARLTIVDTDIPALIAAAEAGFNTAVTLREAIDSASPFLLIGATGELALTDDDLLRFPDGICLAPFATRDFSPLYESRLVARAVPVGRTGIRFELVSGTSLLLLGDGRSMNLFEADSIPNEGYDAYRAGTLIAAKALCAIGHEAIANLGSGFADDAIEQSGLFEEYYRRYLAPQRSYQSTGRHTASDAATPLG